MKKITQIENSVPYNGQLEEKYGKGHYIEISDRVWYFFRYVLTKEQVGIVMCACYRYAENKELPLFDEASYLVFCMVLMENGLITPDGFNIL